MLTSLEIENFKGVKAGKISDLAQVNILVGRNNSGKSTILDAILLMRCPFAEKDYLEQSGLDQILSRRVQRESHDTRELAHMLTAQNPTELKAGFVSGFTLKQAWKFPPDIIELEFKDQNASLTSLFTSLPRPSVYDYDDNEFRRITSFAGDAGTAAHFLARSHLLDSSVIRAPYIEKVWGTLIADRRDRKVRSLINEIYTLDIESFNMTPFGGPNRLVASLPERSVAVDWLGDGLRYAVNILSFGLLMNDTSLLIEEIETHQHPESLRLLTETLFKLAKEQNLQLFLTTHSMEFIGFALEAAEKEGADLALHHLSLDQHGNFESRAISQPDAKLLLDIGHDPRLHYKYTGVQ